MINDKIKELSPAEKKMLKKMAFRTSALSASINVETMQAFGYVYAMAPAIELFYENKEDRIDAYKRHYTVFNSTPACAGVITGLSASMEREAAEDPEFDKISISAVKTALMGPIAGVGDSFFWGTVRTIATGIGLGFATTGNVLGPILMVVIYNTIATISKYYSPFIGYIYGTSLISDMSENGTLKKLTKYATIVGMLTVGAMAATMVSLPITLELNLGGAPYALQSLFDGIMPNIVPLILVMIVLKFLQKGVKSTTIIYVMLIVGIIGKYIGLF